MPREILVTGASGFVGRRLVSALERAGEQVRGFSLEDGDLVSANLDFPEVEHVFHLAARTFVPESWTAPKSFYELNVLGTLNVLEFCGRTGSSLTLISSYVYGVPARLPIAEDHPVAAFNPYSQSKIMAEELARFHASHHGIRLTIVRPFNLYGYGQDARFLIPTLVRQSLDPATPEVQVEDLRPKRDYLCVDDFVVMLVRTWETGKTGVFNAGSGTSVSVEEVARAVQASCGSNKPLVSRNTERRNEVLDIVADISKARRELQWHPRIPLEQGIAAMVERWQSERRR